MVTDQPQGNLFGKELCFQELLIQKSIKDFHLPIRTGLVDLYLESLESPPNVSTMFTIFPCHDCLGDLVVLNEIIKDTMTTLPSLRTTTTTPQSKLNSEVASWNTNHKAITSVSFLVFEKYIGEDWLFSQSTYEGNVEKPNYINSLFPNQKLLNHLRLSVETLKKVYCCYEGAEWIEGTIINKTYPSCHRSSRQNHQY